jgi:hypothetical protein
MMKRWLMVPLLCLGSVANAASLNSLNALNQAQFLTLSENLAAASHYKAITPAEGLGVLGFDIGLSLSSTEIDDSLFDIASEGDYGLSSLLLPRLHANKGLPFGLDIGATLSAAPDTDIKLLGAELRYAIVEGGVALPAVGLRASYSTLQGVDELDLNSAALELLVSKGFLMFTPYGGVGLVRSTASAKDVPGLSDETFTQNKVFAGLNFNIGFNFAIEADRTDDYTTFSAKAGIRF